MVIEAAKRWTRDDLERFPEDGNRYEVLDGELLVTPQAAPDHQFVLARLLYALHGYCTQNLVGKAVGPGAVVWGKNELQPDCEVLHRDSETRGKKWDEIPFPLLAVEILSPFAASRRRDLDTKRKAYLRLGIPEYWVVDQDARVVHVWADGRAERIVSDILRWQPDPSISALEISVDELLGPPAP